ncbi:MAG: uroporphyrinogen decarboxylase [Bacteroidales bacterium]|nr:uroporphyrinogen decarboxylase [Bacteroidales bacterium]
MNSPLLVKTLRRQTTSRPPIWYMRQAGRVLPSYQKLKEKYSFWQMMQNADLAAEVTLLPVHDLGVDAAILFSDILVIPYAMGMGLDFTDNGPVFEKALVSDANPLSRINPNPEKLDYIYRAIDKIIETKPVDIPLIGFCGGPLTVLCYMLEGLSSKNGFPEAIRFMYENKKDTQQLISIIEELSIEYLKKQVEHGEEAFQLFETHAGLVPFDLYQKLFIPMVKTLAKAARELDTPFIYFPKDIGIGIRDITPDMCDFLSIDWQTSLPSARQLVHKDIGLQGNIDPRVLFAGKRDIEQVLDSYVQFGKEHQDWIINLGHGFKPDIPYDKIVFMTEYLKNANWR